MSAGEQGNLQMGTGRGGDALDAHASPHGIEAHAGGGGSDEHEHVGERGLGARHQEVQKND
jgi:hypothetical protein